MLSVYNCNIPNLKNIWSYRGLNQEPSDPEIVDLKMCHHASPGIYTDSVVVSISAINGASLFLLILSKAVHYRGSPLARQSIEAVGLPDCLA